MSLQLEDKSVKTKVMCAGINCKCSASTDSDYCSSICKNSAIDEDSGQCKCNHSVCVVNREEESAKTYNQRQNYNFS